MSALTDSDIATMLIARERSFEFADEAAAAGDITDAAPHLAAAERLTRALRSVDPQQLRRLVGEVRPTFNRPRNRPRRRPAV